MSPPQNPVIVIPARLASKRFPDKPLADMHGEPMIVHVWRRAAEAGIGPVVVACADREIASAVAAVGGRAVMTRPDHPSGSDRVFEALQIIDEAGAFDAVVNVGCDVLTLEPNYIHQVLAPLDEAAVDIGTIAAEIADPAERDDPNVVKAAVALKPGAGIGRALYFSRSAVPTGDGPLYHHIGLYAFRRAALARFVALPPSPLEQRERLEQLRALENGMRIDVALVDTTPLHVNTPADLARVLELLEPGSSG
ncbi:MAG: 3-deoxy-manno-octulosonate cytidylyltransferase [Alphaproteobacteria bacterium]